MAVEDEADRLHVLTVAAVRAGIERLQNRYIHEQFPAYLHLRQSGLAAGSLGSIEPVWREVGRLLRVPGGPPTKPYYRPFSSRIVKDPGGYWFNQNLAGSYAPSSIRSKSRFMLNEAGNGFALPEDHAREAFRAFLRGTRVPAWALAAYYLRNYGFILGGDGGYEDLIVAFKKEFLFEDSADFEILFEDKEPITPVLDWFEVFDSPREVSADAEVPLLRDVRELTADDLSIGYTARAATTHGSSAPDAPLLAPDDPRLETVKRLLQRFGGVILTGPPGTSKTWLAGQLADQITDGDSSRRADIQFHPSYQFEDFMEGYRPKKDGSGFEPRDGVFRRLIKKAASDPDNLYVIVIDELSRADVGRVFGEALTYIERSKRGLTFQLPSGEDCAIPPNLYLIATMNPLDRGVDEVDAAFERRFAKVDMPPDRDALSAILDKNELDPEIAHRLLGWFDKINTRAQRNPQAAVGHAYFHDVVDAESLKEVWEYQLKYHVERAFRHDEETMKEMAQGWSAIFTVASGDKGDDADESHVTRPGT